MRFLLRGDGQSPSNCPLSRRVLGVVLRRKRFRGLGNDFASASAAPIDARMDGCFSGLVLLVELRAVADFYVIAAPEERHRSSSVVRKPQLLHGRRVATLCGRPAACSLRKDIGRVEICFRCFRVHDISAASASSGSQPPPAWKIPNSLKPTMPSVSFRRDPPRSVVPGRFTSSQGARFP